MCINSKCNDNTNFIGKKINERLKNAERNTDYIFKELLLPVHNAIVCVFKKFLPDDLFITNISETANTISANTMSNTYVDKALILVNNNIRNLDKKLNNYYIIQESLLYNDIMKNYYSIIGTLFNSITKFFKQFNENNMSCNIKTNLSSLPISTYNILIQKLYNSFKTLKDKLFSNELLTEKQLNFIAQEIKKDCIAVLNNLKSEINDICNKDKELFYKGMEQITQNINNIKINIHTSKEYFDTILNNLRKEIDSICNKDKELFYKGMEQIIQNIDNIKINIHTSKEYLDDIKRLSTKYIG